MSCVLDFATLLVKDTYQMIDPYAYEEGEFNLGRVLNADEGFSGSGSVTNDGHRIVYINDVFQDSEGNCFRVIDILGNGTFSYVFKCQMIQDPLSFYALKIIRNLPQYRATGIGEIYVHHLLENTSDHPGKSIIVQPVSSFELDGHIVLVFPLLFRSLFEGIFQSGSITKQLAMIRNIMVQILLGLDFLHSNGVTHCDLKPDNILFSNESDENIHIIDLGSATLSEPPLGQYMQSRFYRSPEIVLGLQSTYKIDLWSAGCIGAELFLDFALFACENEYDVIHTMSFMLGEFPESMISQSKGWYKFFDYGRDGYKLKSDQESIIVEKHSYSTRIIDNGGASLPELILNHVPVQSEEEIVSLECFTHFILSLLQIDPDQRMSAYEALHHPFLTEEPFPETCAIQEKHQQSFRKGNLEGNFPKSCSFHELDESFLSVF